MHESRGEEFGKATSLSSDDDGGVMAQVKKLLTKTQSTNPTWGSKSKHSR